MLDLKDYLGAMNFIRLFAIHVWKAIKMLMVLLSFLTLSTWGAVGGEGSMMMFNCKRTAQPEIEL